MTSPLTAHPAVLPDLLARRGSDVASAALAVPTAALAAAAAALVAAAAGLPDGRAGAAASAWAGRAELAVTLWVADVLAHGEALGAAAIDYVEGDEETAGAFAVGGAW